MELTLVQISAFIIYLSLHLGKPVNGRYIYFIFIFLTFYLVFAAAHFQLGASFYIYFNYVYIWLYFIFLLLIIIIMVVSFFAFLLLVINWALGLMGILYVLVSNIVVRARIFNWCARLFQYVFECRCNPFLTGCVLNVVFDLKIN